mgnify:CR=1 FL=1
MNLLDFSSQTGINTKFLRGDGTFQTVQAGGGGGAKHQMQNAGSNLNERASLNFDGTHLIATDDGTNDQTDVTVSSNLQAFSGIFKHLQESLTIIKNLQESSRIFKNLQGCLRISSKTIRKRQQYSKVQKELQE